MLYVTFISKIHLGVTEEFSWHVGSPEFADGKFNSSEYFVEVQADGHELEYILQNFTGLLIRKDRRVITWSGDAAEFIFNNLF